MKRHGLFLLTALTLLADGCSRSADKGQPNEQQRSDIDAIAAKVDNEQTVDLPDDSLAVNESEADAALNRTTPGNAMVGPSPTPVPANGARAPGPR